MSTGTTASSAPAPTPPPVPEPVPVAVSIPAIGAQSSLVPLGLTPDGALDVPPVDQPMQAGYYAGADPQREGDEWLPGEPGPAVVAAHVDGVVDGVGGRPGLFYRLHEIKPGAEVLVDREDGSQLRFVVDRVERHPKDEFPTEAVYGDTDRPALRLITCGGPFDQARDSYVDNWIVWAEQA